MGDKGKKDINKKSKQAKAKKEAKNKKQVKQRGHPSPRIRVHFSALIGFAVGDEPSLEPQLTFLPKPDLLEVAPMDEIATPAYAGPYLDDREPVQ